MEQNNNKAKGILEEMGLSKDEIQVYLLLVSKGPLTVLQIHKKTGIPRSSVYKLTNDLSKKKYVEFLVVYPGVKVKAVRPKDLGIILQEEKRGLNKKKKAIKSLARLDIKALQNSPKTEVRYYKGVKGMKQLVWNSLDCEGPSYGYSVWDRNVVLGEAFEERYSREYRKRGFVDQVIINRKSLEQIKKKIARKKKRVPSKSRQVRVLMNDNFYVAGDTYIYNNIYAVNLWRGYEIWGVEIENEKLVEEQKGIFKILWKMSKPYEECLRL